MIQRLLRFLKRDSICICKGTKIPHKHVLFESAPLEGERTTTFTIAKCSVCGGWYGFPEENFKIAIKNGTPALFKAFEDLGLKVNRR